MTTYYVKTIISTDPTYNTEVVVSEFIASPEVRSLHPNWIGLSLGRAKALFKKHFQNR